MATDSTECRFCRICQQKEQPSSNEWLEEMGELMMAAVKAMQKPPSPLSYCQRSDYDR